MLPAFCRKKNDNNNNTVNCIETKHKKTIQKIEN